MSRVINSRLRTVVAVLFLCLAAAGCANDDSFNDMFGSTSSKAAVPHEVRINFVLWGWQPQVYVSTGPNEQLGNEQTQGGTLVDCYSQLVNRPCTNDVIIPTGEPATITFGQGSTPPNATSIVGWQYPVSAEGLDGSSCKEEQSVFDAAVKLNLSPPQSFALVCRIAAINHVETFDAHWRSGIMDFCYNKPGNIPPLTADILAKYGRIYSVVDFPKPVPPPPSGAPNSVTCQPPSDALASQKG